MPEIQQSQLDVPDWAPLALEIATAIVILGALVTLILYMRRR